jgi:uncharacterized damage-inducible protein DinB
MSLNEPIIAEFKQEALTTRKLLERVPLESLGWKPHEKSMTMEQLALHIADLSGFLQTIFTSDELDLAIREHQSPKVNAISDILERFDANVAGTIDLLKKQTDEHLLQFWKMRLGEKVIVDLPRLTVLRSMINHYIHHRGQLSVYLRLKDVPLPSIYGPSADETL